MRGTEVFLRKHGSTILTCLGAAGVVATTVTAVKVTPKALILLEQAKEEKGEDLTTLEKVKVAGPVYIPTALFGASTIACIFAANCISNRTQTAITTAYTLLDTSFKEYRNRVEEVCDEETLSEIDKGLMEKRYHDGVRTDDGKLLFFDYQSMRYFESTMEDMVRAEHIFNQQFMMSGFACLNELYDILDIPRVDYGHEVGWSSFAGNEIYGYSEIKFNYQHVFMDDGLECYILMIDPHPTLDYIY